MKKSDTLAEESPVYEAAPMVAPTPAPTPAPAPVNLTDISTRTLKDALEATLEFKGGFKLKLKYVSKAALFRLTQDCVEHVWNDKRKQNVPQLNNDMFVERFSRMAVLGWTGATVEVISSLAPLNNEGLDPKAEIPFSFENLVWLMRNAFDLDDFLQNSATDVSLFRRNTDAALKN